MNRYSGNRGLIERIPDSSAHRAARGLRSDGMERGMAHETVYNASVRETEHGSARGGGLLSSLPFANLFSDKKPPDDSLLGGLGGIGKLLSKFTKETLEMEDYLLLGMLYLLYRESKDIEFLLIAGAMLIL